MANCKMMINEVNTMTTNLRFLATRSEVIQKLWAYIKKNNLLDPENKAMIMCDDKLKKLCGGEIKVRGFGLAIHFAKHMS